MSIENAAIIGVFRTEEIGLTNPARTACALAGGTFEGIRPHALHASLLGLEQSQQILNKITPSVIGINVATSEELGVLYEIVSKLKREHPRSNLIVGGFYPSIYLEKTLQIPGVDAVVRGWGEDAWYKITETVYEGHPLNRLSGYPGIYLAGETLPQELHNAKPIKLSKIEQPNYFVHHPALTTFIDPKLPLAERIASFQSPNVLSGIGCELNCIFCIQTAYHKPEVNNFGRPWVEHRLPNQVAREIKNLFELAQVPILPIYLSNPDSFSDFYHFLSILQELEHLGLKDKVILGLDVKIKSLIKAATENDIFFNRLGGRIFRLTIAPETLDPDTANIIACDKQNTAEEVTAAIEISRMIGAMPVVQIMIGFPWDSEESLERTLKTLLEIRDETGPFAFSVNRVSPYPGTTLHMQVINMGVLNKNNGNITATTSGGVAEMGTLTLSAKRIEEWIRRFVGEFFSEDYLKRIKDDNTTYELLKQLLILKARVYSERSVRSHFHRVT